MTTHNEALESAVVTWFEGNDAFVEDWHIEQMEAAIRAYLGASGLVMVPKEATQDMIDAAWDAPVGEIYTEMLAAAPDPFKEATP